jgi:haloacetate dehalogenase
MTGQCWRSGPSFFWPSPAPLPEKLILAAPEAVVDNALCNWGTPASTFSDDVRADYVAALNDPRRVHSICEEYRAAAGVDREIDQADRVAGRRIAQPLLALWSASGGLSTWYENEGGPLSIWRSWANDVRGQAVDGGHFFPEEHSEATADLLRTFLHGDKHARDETVAIPPSQA